MTPNDTLAAIDAALRRADRSRQLWLDPEWAAWEANQISDLMEEERVGDVLVWRWAYPGPAHPRYGSDTTTEDEVGVHVRAMVTLGADLPHVCDTVQDPDVLRLRCMSKAMTTGSTDYPAPEDTVHGPLLLGPDPDWSPWVDPATWDQAKTPAPEGLCAALGRDEAESTCDWEGRRRVPGPWQERMCRTHRVVATVYSETSAEEVGHG